VAFWAYTRTLLPGVDLGDTGGFQAAVLWPEISARQAYPLYYALAKPFVAAVSDANPARGLNLFSAVWAAITVGLLTGITAFVSRSLVGGVTAGLLLAFSYTFWTQAVIAEVYSLHLALVSCCLVALAAYAQRPGIPRLALFFAIYALSFGNHLSMILLLLPFAAFLLMTTERRATLLRPATIGLAVAIACAGALQYLPNLLVVWTAVDAPERWTDRFAAFWFDVTKADWRASMVAGIASNEVADRFRLYTFDARQQFGSAGWVLMATGAVALWRTSRPWAVLVLLAYLVNTIFAFTYNVGDPHVFFLPGHYFAAFVMGCFIATAMRGTRFAAVVMAIFAACYVTWRGYDTWPAADRHLDDRAERMGQRLTIGLDERDALLVTSLNWQIENLLLYDTRYRATNVAWTRLADVFLHFPMLVKENQIGRRDIVLTPIAAAQVASAFGPLFAVTPDPFPPTPTLSSTVASIPRGALYALTVLTPPRDEVLDEEDLEDAIVALTGGAPPTRIEAAYEVIVGLAGEAPTYYRSSTRPFRDRVHLVEGDMEIRMESWVPLETFRRGGFGHVILDRERMMFIERGLSLAWREPTQQFYAAGLYALRPRFRIPATGTPGFALLH
jgi:hypothetical protein